jgi:glycerol-3-phosphate dehydrogenase
MINNNPAWLAQQRQRFMRPDAARYISPDAYRFMPPGASDSVCGVVSAGAVRNVVGIRCGAISGNMKVSFQAARSIG